ncbi:MAG: Protein-glutamine gamma-glutamyltransferase [Promethearchaeota archaeon]|nr:MAG: Protein-glutamine gamma-glutamyltransferase [Candidatus Lokiarchaeota archaeon]
MKNIKLLIITEFVFFSIFLPFSVIGYNHVILNSRNLSHNSADQTNPYEIEQGITYEVEVNFSLTNLAGSNKYLFKLSRLDDREVDSPSDQFCPPYQMSDILYSDIDNTDEEPAVIVDRFGNSYDLFNSTLNSNEKVILNQKYSVKLNEITFEDVDYSLITEYDTSSEIFALYCNKSEPNFERDDPNLIQVSNNLVGPSDNPIEKAEKICDWVSSYLEYDDSLGAAEKGALWAYENGIGDCSEFSSLMITLLRIQGIPSRKVTGYMISNNPNFDYEKGKSLEFSADNSEGSNFLGHSWIEYYVAGVGWIASDPTFHREYNYFNRIDSLRFNLNIGSWFTIPGIAPPNNKISEFSNPLVLYQSGASFEFEYGFNITIMDIESSDLPKESLNLDQGMTNLLILCGVIIGIIGLLGILIRKRNRN